MRRANYLNLTRLWLALVIGMAYFLVQTQAVYAGTLSFGGGSTGWTETIAYCQNGFSITSNGGAAGAGITSTVVITGSSVPLSAALPATAASVVGTGSGTPTITATAQFGFTNTQSVGTSVSVTVSRQDNGVDIGGSPQTDIGTVQGCMLSAGGFNPGDNRVSPHAADRMAVYCHGDLGSIDILGIGNDSKGFSLTSFYYPTITAAGSKGLTNKLGANGSVSIAQISPFTFYLAWNGGIYSATGQGPFAKTFSCAFATNLPPTPPKTITSNPAAGASGGRFVYVVQPGDHLFRIALRFGTTVAAIAAINGIRNPDLIYVGQALIIP